MRLRYFVGYLDMISVGTVCCNFEWFLTRIDGFDSKRFIAFMSPFFLVVVVVVVVGGGIHQITGIHNLIDHIVRNKKEMAFS